MENNLVTPVFHHENSLDERNSFLVESVHEAAAHAGMVKVMKLPPKTVFKHSWFDGECINVFIQKI